MHRKVIFIINPISGTQTKSGIRLLVENTLAAANIPCLVFPSVASGDYMFLKDIIQEQNITDVLIAGGDGWDGKPGYRQFIGCKSKFWNHSLWLG